MTNPESRIVLPEVPLRLRDHGVAAWREDVTIDTYAPMSPDRYPAYLERRVYQGSSGRVYPMPFIERISETKAPQAWDAIHLDNRYVRLMILPGLGGRIYCATDKTRDYDFFYRNNVVKPALVGVLGPWISGGVEFNWPQHHRPATYLPTEARVEQEDDGAVTVWCTDLDPFARMRATHGVRLRPDSSLIELRVRLTNRTDETQTFLWWANVAAPAGDDYQSFFPTDVTEVADHAKRAVTSFPRANGRYYGVEYPARVDNQHPDGDRLDWYRNIPVPTSYMCVRTQDDFFGGYDHARQAGFVHVADHHISPGKKQWTWGNAPFGWAWDRNLTDTDGPYVELMAGVYTDNQPDFSFLAPGETKSFSQFWYPIQDIGVAHQANTTASIHLDVHPVPDAGPEAGLATAVTLGVAVSRPLSPAHVVLMSRGEPAWSTDVDIAPGQPLLHTMTHPGALAASEVSVQVSDARGVVISWTPRPAATTQPPLQPATEPPAPADVESVDQLYLTGLHLEQYRHATRSPEPYWAEGLRRDPGDARCNTALAWRRYRAADFRAAASLCEAAINRLTTLNPNPRDGEAYYLYGLVLRELARPDGAYDALAKAAWSAAWRVPAWVAMARLDLSAGRAATALQVIRRALECDPTNLQARALEVVALRVLGEQREAQHCAQAALQVDPLDFWVRDLAGVALDIDAQVLVDVALEYASCGCTDDALRVLHAAAQRHRDEPVDGMSNPAPMVAYHAARVLAEAGRDAEAAQALQQARTVDATRCFPMRLADAVTLMWAHRTDPGDARALALLGHWLYAAQRNDVAIAAWLAAVNLDDSDPVVRRNLGVAAFNIEHDVETAREHYERALELAPRDAKLWYERDQLAARTGETPATRLARLQAHRELVDKRDDLTVAFANLLVLTGRAEAAAVLLDQRTFQPWEGGEGQVLAAWEETHLALARAALERGAGADAVAHARLALQPPEHLGEARHLLANTARLYLCLGDALAATGAHEEAAAAWSTAAHQDGDFQEMATAAFSDKSYYSALAWRRIGQDRQCDTLVDAIAAYARDLTARPAQIDYFATSLPALLLFNDDLDARAARTAMLLQAQVAAVRGQDAVAAELLGVLLREDPGNVLGHEVAAHVRRAKPGLCACPASDNAVGTSVAAQEG